MQIFWTKRKKNDHNLGKYRTLAIITRGFYYFSVFSHVGISLMFGSVTMTLGGYKTRAVIIRARLMMASVRYTIPMPFLGAQ